MSLLSIYPSRPTIRAVPYRTVSHLDGCYYAGFHQRRDGVGIKDHYFGQLSLQSSTVTRGHRYKLFKKRKGTLGQKFFSARVVDLWNALDDSTVSVDNVTAFKRKLGKLGY